MATKKKPSTSKSRTSAKTKAAKPRAVPKTALAKKDDPIQDTIALVRGFQLNTLIALGLTVAFLVFQLIPDLRYIWWLNIPTAAVSGYMFWRQDANVTGVEAKVCRYGLFTVAALFLWRDIYLSNQLNELQNWDIFTN